MKNIHKIRENIYITSDEEIKDCNCYVINAVGEMGKRNVFKPIKVTEEIVRKEPLITYPNGGWCKKIILTTDQDLIKYGVQEIDDEFLEWFVKNPSCEEVEVESNYRVKSGTIQEHNEGKAGYEYYEYKIIIPKEESKQEALEEFAERYSNNELSKLGFIDGAKSDVAKAYWYNIFKQNL